MFNTAFISCLLYLNMLSAHLTQAYASEVCRKEYQALGMSIVREPLLLWLLKIDCSLISIEWIILVSDQHLVGHWISYWSRTWRFSCSGISRYTTYRTKYHRDDIYLFSSTTITYLLINFGNIDTVACREISKYIFFLFSVWEVSISPSTFLL